MKYINKKNLIIWAMWIVILFSAFSIINRNNTVQKAKINLLKEQIETLWNKDEVKLVNLIKEKKEKWESLERLIEAMNKNLITVNKYETCYKNQLDRLVNWLEYWINYCEDNLENFGEGL